ncbi:hypothetical protein HNR73_001454 [Phytomonospora endophytica]|uniref:Uncharacterized protein n=1 Tax=Phytomonospora endophytica TaxID=714109 RepID=A0A841FCT2_9ACTN|nr:hypothetical protein [Phytomonospora endophytica]
MKPLAWRIEGAAVVRDIGLSSLSASPRNGNSEGGHRADALRRGRRRT